MNFDSIKYRIIIISTIIFLMMIFLNSVVFKITSDIEKVYNVALYLPLTGKYSSIGEHELNGINLAYIKKRVNYKATINLKVYDNKSNLKDAKKQSVKIKNNNKIDMVISGYGDELTTVLLNELKTTKIPVISTISGNSENYKAYEYYLSRNYLDSFQSGYMADYLMENENIKTIGILKNTKSEFSNISSTGLNDELVKLGSGAPKVTVEIDYDDGLGDIEYQLKNIEYLNPDVVFLPDELGISAEIIKKAREMGVQSIFAGTSKWGMVHKIADKSYMKGSIYTSPYPDESGSANRIPLEFNRFYINSFNEDPSLFSLMGYQTYSTFLNMIAYSPGNTDKTASLLNKIIEYKKSLSTRNANRFINIATVK